MLREREINDFVNGRQLFILTAILFVACAVMTSFSGRVAMQGCSSGVCFSSASVLTLSPIASSLLNVGVILGTCFVLGLINKMYSLIRDVTYVYASSFLLLVIANPHVTALLYDGTLLALISMFLAVLLFGLYQHPHPQRRVFLISSILSTCCMFQYAFAYLIPVFFIGFLQMRAMNFRSLLAMFFGLATPFWIVLGTGMVSLDTLQPPHLENVWMGLDLSQSRFLIVTLACSVLLTVFLLIANVLHIINYKMQVRAYNGFFLVLSFFTMVMMAIDYNNALVYLPVLYVCMSIQMAHSFTIGRFQQRYIPYLLFAIACIGVFVWRVIL